MSFMEINDDDSIKPSHVEDKDTIYIVCSNYNCIKNCYDRTETTSVFIITLIHPINLMKYQTHIDIRRLAPNLLEI